MTNTTAAEAGQEDWYASPLHSSRLRNLPPPLILSVEGAPLARRIRPA
jgi:acetyl esterase/lipase